MRTPQQDYEFWLERCVQARKNYRFSQWLIKHFGEYKHQSTLDSLLEITSRLEELERQKIIELKKAE